MTRTENANENKRLGEKNKEENRNRNK